VDEASIKVGIIGAGHIATSGHLPAWKTIPDIEVCAIADKNRALAKKAAREFEIPMVFEDITSLIRNCFVDIIDVCTPPLRRLDILGPAILSGKHVLVEKPLSTNLAECLKIYHMLKNAGTKLNVVQNYRYFKSSQRAKGRISKGYLSDVLSIVGIASNPFPIDSGTRATWFYHEGGVLCDFVPHLIDLMLWLNAWPFESVFAYGGDFTNGNMGFFNDVQALIRFRNGAIGLLDTSWLTGITMLKIEVRGSAGYISIDIRNDHFFETHSNLTMPIDEVKSEIGKIVGMSKRVLSGDYFIGSYRFFRPLFVDFLNAIKGRCDVPVPIEQAIITNALLEGIKKSLLMKIPINIDSLFSSKDELEEILNRVQ